ncbi:MAG: PEP/pyruvate-binding domain-containing protein [Candidatus Dojkabacteria bacterium]|nr:PEP/pyruvate-binding domain-containing protein [Candidatus Dojkabacteria bacterium]
MKQELSYTLSLSDKSSKLDPFLLGNKGRNLCDLKRMNIQVPPGFIITTQSWKQFKKDKKISKEVNKSIFSHLNLLEKETGRTFGDTKNPLVVSTRSSSRYSMPGILDTILNVGINEEIVESLAKEVGEFTAYDSYRRLIQMFGTSISDIAPHVFGEIVNDKQADHKLSIKEIKKLIDEFKRLFKDTTGGDFPQDPFVQLQTAIEAIFNSWDKRGARMYRKYNAIPEDIGTAAVVEQMVFGNATKSGSGVYFTRNPNDGSQKPFTEYLDEIQGEDIVGGTHSARKSSNLGSKKLTDELKSIGQKLEKHYQKPQDIEFTVEHDHLWVLQTRELRMTGMAALNVASDMLREGILTENEAVRLIKDHHVKQVTQAQISSDINYTPFAEGIPASPGAANGKISLSNKSENLKDSIYITNHIDPNDLETIYKSNGIITTLGGAASHIWRWQAASIPR